jgi:UDP:flavonoid glycosyltransferase YjiC (YdhE family)
VKLTGFPLYDEPEVSPMSEELLRFLEAGDPPIAFTPGSAMWQAEDFFRASADACAKIGRRGLLLSRHADHIPSHLPPDVIHVHYAPFSQLLPRCAAFVHHGGIGSTAQALAAGVPQLVMPFAHDQPDNGDKIRRLGVGEVLPAPKYNANRSAAALTRLLSSPSVSARCAEIKHRFDGVDAIGQTCDLIESLAGNRR